MTTTVSLTKNATNAEINAAFGDLLADGKTRVFAFDDSKKNASRVTLFMCQQIKTQTQATEIQKMFLGWGEGTRVLRGIFSADKAIVSRMGLTAGSVVPFDILVEEKTQPAYDNQSPKINPTTGEIITHNNLPVYEHSSLVPLGQGAKVISLPRNAEVPFLNMPEANLMGS
jgi:hypothetical protein